VGLLVGDVSGVFISFNAYQLRGMVPPEAKFMVQYNKRACENRHTRQVISFRGPREGWP
jgi:hypothetical protein